MTRLLMLLAFAVTSATMISSTSAQSRALERLYGRGVHAYFDGQLSEAMIFFDQAVNHGSKDPRVFYFRGVTHSALGDSHSAKADFDRGADLEVNSSSQAYPVNRSLQRIQGTVRLEIEASRNLAAYVNTTPVGNHQGQPRMIQPNTETIAPGKIDLTPRVQRQPGKVNFPDVSDLEEPTDLFDGEGEAVEVPDEPVEPQVADTTPETTETETPVADEQPVEPKEVDPFGEEMPAEGDDEPADDDPFGDGDSDDEPADDDPFGDGESDDEPADDDPFGDGESDDEPADDEPADDDPFGDDGSADDTGGDDEPTEDDDPFGDG